MREFNIKNKPIMTITLNITQEDLDYFLSKIEVKLNAAPTAAKSEEELTGEVLDKIKEELIKITRTTPSKYEPFDKTKFQYIDGRDRTWDIFPPSKDGYGWVAYSDLLGTRANQYSELITNMESI